MYAIFELLSWKHGRTHSNFLKNVFAFVWTWRAIEKWAYVQWNWMLTSASRSWLSSGVDGNGQPTPSSSSSSNSSTSARRSMLSETNEFHGFRLRSTESAILPWSPEVVDIGSSKDSDILKMFKFQIKVKLIWDSVVVTRNRNELNWSEQCEREKKKLYSMRKNSENDDWLWLRSWYEVEVVIRVHFPRNF